MKDIEKYSWFNPEAKEWLRREVEMFIMGFPSMTHFVYECKKCGHRTPGKYDTPFGLDQLLDFMVNEFRAMERNHNMNRLKELCIAAFGPEIVHDPREAKP